MLSQNNPLALDDLKRQAKRLRTTLAGQGQTISHSGSLELLAKQLGFRDWNTLHSAAGNRPATAPVDLGAHVSGIYLGQAFDGEVVGVQTLSLGRFRVTLDFDDPVDVVTFDSFSAFRKRVSATIGNDGSTVEKTSDGEPQMRITTRN